jgi:hypothetical protein
MSKERGGTFRSSGPSRANRDPNYVRPSSLAPPKLAGSATAPHRVRGDHSATTTFPSTFRLRKAAKACTVWSSG